MSISKKINIYGTLLIGFLSYSTASLAVGNIPVPSINDIELSTDVTLDSTLKYKYQYSAYSPASNIGDIWQLKMDVTYEIFSTTRQVGEYELTIPFGPNTTNFLSFIEKLKPIRISPIRRIQPIGQEVPLGWTGGINRVGYAMFSTTATEYLLTPGGTLEGINIISYSPPTIRTMEIVPNWVFQVLDHSKVTEKDKADAADAYNNILISKATLGPSAPDYNAYRESRRIYKDFVRLKILNWFSNKQLEGQIITEFELAKNFLEAIDVTSMRQKFDLIESLIKNSTVQDRTADGYNLVLHNIRWIRYLTQDFLPLFIPEVSIDPVVAKRKLGEDVTIKLKVINTADHNKPVPDFEIYMDLVEGPNEPNYSTKTTDVNGELFFSYIGTKPGTDKIRFYDNTGEVTIGTTLVNWDGGVDMVVPIFAPPRLESKGGETVYLTDVTKNIGNITSAVSTTRYYISKTNEQPDPATSQVVGERRVYELLPDQADDNQLIKTLPVGLDYGLYYLAACADADNEIIETNENNNCSYSILENYVSYVVPLARLANAPPNCTEASASKNILWPPNHKLQKTTINGVTDPDTDPVTIKITSIKQDEPVNGLGDGDTSPDGFGVGTPVAKVRAERSGLEDGRVYIIGFEASDDKGATCSNSVNVGVPHDKKSTPIDSGARYDSTQK